MMFFEQPRNQATKPAKLCSFVALLFNHSAIRNCQGFFSGVHFGMDDGGNPACQKPILPDNKTMSAQEILIEEIKRQPEPVVREVLHYLKFLERQRAQEEVGRRAAFARSRAGKTGPPRRQMNPRHGEVWLVDMGMTAKTRPAVVLIADISTPRARSSSTFPSRGRIAGANSKCRSAICRFSIPNPSPTCRPSARCRPCGLKSGSASCRKRI